MGSECTVARAEGEEQASKHFTLCRRPATILSMMLAGLPDFSACSVRSFLSAAPIKKCSFYKRCSNCRAECYMIVPCLKATTSSKTKVVYLPGPLQGRFFCRETVVGSPQCAWQCCRQAPAKDMSVSQ